MASERIFKSVRLMILLMLVVLLNNCKEVIKLDSNIQGGILTVNGKVNTLNEAQQLLLGYTSPEGRTPTAASGAFITLFSGSGTSWSYYEKTPGNYVIDEGTAVITPGETYHVDISFAGQTYRSDPETVPLLTGVDHPYFEYEAKSEIENNIVIKRNVVNVLTDAELPQGASPQYFKWDVEEYYMFEETPRFNPLLGGLPLPCFVKGYPDPQRVNLFTTENQASTQVSRNLIAIRTVDQSFLAKHWFMVKLSSVTQQAYAYWKNVNSLANRGGSIFDTPPAPIHGNIHNVEDETEIVYGYFEASNTSLQRLYLLRGNIPFTIPFYCNDPVKGVYSSDYPPECSSCLTLTGSTHTAPEWFF